MTRRTLKAILPLSSSATPRDETLAAHLPTALIKSMSVAKRDKVIALFKIVRFVQDTRAIAIDLERRNGVLALGGLEDLDDDILREHFDNQVTDQDAAFLDAYSTRLAELQAYFFHQAVTAATLPEVLNDEN